MLLTYAEQDQLLKLPAIQVDAAACTVQTQLTGRRYACPLAQDETASSACVPGPASSWRLDSAGKHPEVAGRELVADACYCARRVIATQLSRLATYCQSSLLPYTLAQHPSLHPPFQQLQPTISGTPNHPGQCQGLLPKPEGAILVPASCVLCTR